MVLTDDRQGRARPSHLCSLGYFPRQRSARTRPPAHWSIGGYQVMQLLPIVLAIAIYLLAKLCFGELNNVIEETEDYEERNK